MCERTVLEKTYSATCGVVHYWVSEHIDASAPWLVFLPGLTADHRLFDAQVECFESRANCLVWDPPAHGASRPYGKIDLRHWAELLHAILMEEGAESPVLVGQSMGGFLSQMVMELYPGYARGFISIDSAPLQRAYYRKWELWSLKHAFLMYMSFPWKTLVRMTCEGVSRTAHGKQLMRDTILQYGKREYCALAAKGFKTVAESIEEGGTYFIDCPALILCGDADAAAFTSRYNEAWATEAGIPLVWVPSAGHNANVDNPQFVNGQIEQFLESLVVG